MIELDGIAVAGGSRIGTAALYEETPGTAIPLVPSGHPEAELEREKWLKRREAGKVRLKKLMEEWGEEKEVIEL